MLKDLSKELEIAKMAAKLAGEKIRDVYKKDFRFEIKEDSSPVTEADIKANDIIVKILSTEFPQYSILSEETKDDFTRLKNKWCWIVDPLDGTKEFIKRNDEFTVNIALSRNGKVVLGVVYAPVFDEMYFGVKGMGAFTEKKNKVAVEIKVSDRIEHINGLQSRSRPGNMCANIYDNNRDKVTMVTNMGSSLKGCKIAEGLYDVYFNCGFSMIWDTAAMEIIIHEAGGILRQLNGNPIIYNKEKIINDRGFYILNREENNLMKV
jgi:3'(2'), 5'-bisphosphate nucleotidase